MSGHTPGPWMLGDDDHVYGSGGGSPIAAVYDAEDYPCFTAGLEPGDGGEVGRREFIEECAANARLIVAAPKLLAACKAAFDALTSTDELFRYENLEAIGQLEAAIAETEEQL